MCVFFELQSMSSQPTTNNHCDTNRLPTNRLGDEQIRSESRRGIIRVRLAGMNLGQRINLFDE